MAANVDLDTRITATFRKMVAERPDANPAIAAVRILNDIITEYSGKTVNGLVECLKLVVTILEKSPGKSKLAVSSACAQFIRFTTLYLTQLETSDFSEVKQWMLREGLKYLKRCEQSIRKIAKFGVPLIYDGARVVVHSTSRVVLETLRSVPDNIYFTVYIVVSSPKEDSYQLKRPNIDVVYIPDSEVGTRMEEVDLVLVGAEAVVKNGGIINRVGTLPLAICAKEMNKPLYVLAESFKFSLLYPLNQKDIPKIYREFEESTDEFRKFRVDYTPPKYLTLLVTDRGLLTPVAVCDELVEMYT